jgi:hypothetical protein
MDDPGSTAADLPLPDPFPDYLVCPHCGEPEVEVWCYQTQACCHRCGGWIDHQPHDDCKIGPTCQPGIKWKRLRLDLLLEEEDGDPADDFSSQAPSG